MTDAVTRAAEVLKEHRASIDRLDAILRPCKPGRSGPRVCQEIPEFHYSGSDPTPQNTSIRISYPKGNFCCQKTAKSA